MKTSEEIKQIASAMVEVQKELKGISPNANNPFFKSSYITLDNILEVVRPILSKNGIWLTQEATGDTESITVTTRLTHSSGEFIETDTLKMKPQKINDPQQLGSCITYAKRYQLSAMLGISSEVDDDGNTSSWGTDKPKKITKKMADEMRELCKRKGISEQYICKFKGISKFEEMTTGVYVQARDWLNKKEDK